MTNKIYQTGRWPVCPSTWVIQFHVEFRLKISYDINMVLKANNAVGTFFIQFQKFQFCH